MPRGKTDKSLRLIATAQAILTEIQPASVRAVCYRLFVAGLIPDMRKTTTNGVSTQLVYAREQGIIPWEWIVDETRSIERIAAWADLAEYAEVVQDSYRKDYWATQPRRVEIWSEKSTVAGTLRPVLSELGVEFHPFHGYNSATRVMQAAQGSAALDQALIVFYVGDRDPSGMHMSERDLPRRLARYGGNVEMTRLALTLDDCLDNNLSSFPAADKVTDTRYPWFVANFGDTCWELDALNPNILRQKVRDAIEANIEPEAWAEAEQIEKDERARLAEVVAEFKNGA